MHEAKILHCEPEPDWQRKVADYLRQHTAHEVVAVADSYADSLRQLAQLAKGSHPANVILMSNRLRGGDWVNHPKAFVSQMEHRELQMPVIGLSMGGLALKKLAVGRELVADIFKTDFETNPDLLLDVLDNLPEPPITKP